MKIIEFTKTTTDEAKMVKAGDWIVLRVRPDPMLNENDEPSTHADLLFENFFENNYDFEAVLIGIAKETPHTTLKVGELTCCYGIQDMITRRSERHNGWSLSRVDPSSTPSSSSGSRHMTLLTQSKSRNGEYGLPNNMEVR